MSEDTMSSSALLQKIREFSKQERTVFKLMVQMKSNAEMAQELGVHNKTIRFHLGNIYSKLGIDVKNKAKRLAFTEMCLDYKPKVELVG